MDIWEELQRFYDEWKEIIKNGVPDDFGFDSSDGKHHIFMYQTDEYSDNGKFEWYIEVNNVVDGCHEPLQTIFSPVDDDAYLMVQIAWCIERFW